MYKAIFKTDERVEPSPLLEEFNRWPHGPLHPIYSGNEGWTGITVLNSLGIDRLDELPVLRAYVESVGRDEVTGVGYFNLQPRARLHRHRDMYGNLLFGISRLHIPIKTNPRAIMEVQRIPYHLGLGEVWCLDTSGLHALSNDSDENRIHIVVDVRRSERTRKYFPRWRTAVVLHMAFFVLNISWKVLRDVVTKPKSVLGRIRGLRSQLQ